MDTPVILLKIRKDIGETPDCEKHRKWITAVLLPRYIHTYIFAYNIQQCIIIMPIYQNI